MKKYAKTLIRRIVHQGSNYALPAVYLGNSRALIRTIYGHKMYIDTRDESIAPHLLIDGYWELWINHVVQGTVKAGMNVLEIGANLGYYTLLLASIIGAKGKLYAFEANPKVFKNLFSNVLVNGFSDRVELVNKAAVDKSGAITFYALKKLHGSGSIVDLTGEAYLNKIDDEAETFTVDAVSVDDFLKDKPARIDFIKMDAEGSEPRIFNGMQGLIRNNLQLTIIAEFSPDLVRGTGCDPRLFLEQLQDSGFNLRFIDEDATIKTATPAQLLSMPSCELFLKRS